MIIGEYFLLPTVDSSHRFLYRFKFSNTITGWLYDYIYLSNAAMNSDFSVLLKKFMLDKYRKVISESFASYQTDIPESVLDLLKDHEIKLVECDIAPKKDPDGYMKEIV